MAPFFFVGKVGRGGCALLRSATASLLFLSLAVYNTTPAVGEEGQYTNKILDHKPSLDLPSFSLSP